MTVTMSVIVAVGRFVAMTVNRLGLIMSTTFTIVVILN
jgi:hypothetical protein